MHDPPVAQLAADAHTHTPEQVWVDGHMFEFEQSQRPELMAPMVMATHTRLLAHASPQPPQLSSSAPRFLQLVAFGPVLQQTDAADVALHDRWLHFGSAQSI